MSNARNVINGTHGKVFFDDDEVMQLKAFQTKDEYKKEEVQCCGKMSIGYKVVAVDGKGSLKTNKVDSMLIKKLALRVRKDGKTPTFTLVGSLADPDALGAERIAFYNVVFDDLTLFDFENAKNGEIEAPFTYEDLDLLDTI
nr:MAG TPA: tail tube protein [Caudoviricetes sp.]